MFRIRVTAVCVCLALLIASSLVSAAPLVPDNINQLIQDRDYEAAVKAIDEAAKDAKLPQDYLAFLKARSLHFQKKYDEAIAAFDAMLTAHPKSDWSRHARFAKAVSLARKGDFRAAELAYRTEAEFLLSLDRKQEVANIYLEFADAFFKPETEEHKPDYQKALSFYQQALEVGPKLDSRVKIELQIAECFQKLGDHANAMNGFTAFIKDHGQHELVIEARFRLGESQLAAGQLEPARRTWQDLIELHKAAKSERLAEATFEISRTYNIPAPQNEEQLSLGVAALASFIEKYPDHKLASQAHLRIAQSYQNFGRYEDAVNRWNQFLKDERYKDTEEIPEARYQLGVSLKLQGKFDEALATWSDYLVKHPTHKYWSHAQREIIDAEYLKAHTAFEKRNYAEARKLWTAFLEKYPLDGRSPAILFRLGQMHYAEEHWDEAIAAWRRLVSKYPDTNESSQAQFMIAATLEGKQNKLDEALKEYRKVTWGNFQPRAQQRIDRLTAKSFSVATERVFRSGETPQIKLTSRNLETVTVRVYRVDLETYFRKMHLARGVEQLDISLIDPDATFEFKIPGYEKYKLIECQVDVPLPKVGAVKEAEENAGVMAVTVGSETLEATTMLLQSDLDVIVKSSRDEVFVFAENMRTGKPWADARILVSNGKTVFAEGVTGADGVFQKALEELKTAEDVRVFAVTDSHTASNVVGLDGLGVAQGLSPKGYIYTDRPAYRAGQMVHVRGILRQVSGDTYKIEADKKYQVEVYDNRNRLVHEAEVALNSFGTFHDNFLLPVSSPQGEYRIHTHDDDKQSYQGTFVVHQYQLEPVQLEIDVERTVFYRGEEIEGTIRASFYYGAPVIGREIRYQLAGGRTYTAQTDAAGEVKFKLATRDFRESQTLVMAAALPERNLQTTRNLFLATQGFSLSASTIRSVYLGGETFEVTAKAVDAEGKPVEQAVTLSVLRQNTIDGSTGEVLVEKHELKTGADGSALQTLKLAEGGNYVLRVEGVDRFENLVTAQSTVSISDDKDEVRLRILANRHTFNVGDTAKVQVHWREEPALALVTFQGARILDYQLVQLKKGANAIEIPMTAQLAPNFEYSVAVMIDKNRGDDKPEDIEAAGKDQAGKNPPRRFHEASSPFTVDRDLRVELTIKPKGDAKAAKPGDDIELTIKTTDPQGKPVSAEVSVAMVEQSLLARFGSPLSSVTDFFRGMRRQSAVRTTSSADFMYRPNTQRINLQLLAERDRLEVLEDETRRLDEMRAGALSALDAVAAGDVEAAPSLVDLDDNRGWGRPFVTSSVLPVMGGSVPPNSPATDTFGGGFGQQAQQQLELQQSQTITQNFATLGIAGGQNGIAIQSGDNDWSVKWRGLTQTRSSNMSGEQIAQANGKPSANFAIDHFSDSSVRFLYENNQSDIQVLDGKGAWKNLNLKAALGDKWNDEHARAVVEKLTKDGAVLLPHLAPHETCFWNPGVTTDDKGQAVVAITLPERSTAWSVLARGITADTLAGEAADELAVSKDLFGQLKLSEALTDGDEVDVIASVHNSAIAEGKIEVKLEMTIGDKTTSELKTFDVKEKGINELTFRQKIALPEKTPPTGAPTVNAEFVLTIVAGERRDVVRRSVPVRPYGMSVFAISGGSAAGDVSAIVQPPKDMTIESPRLQIVIGPTVEQSLLDVVLAPATWCQVEANRVTSGGESAVSDLMAALGLQKLVGATREAANPHAQSLDARIRSSISLLVSLQNDDGGWSWAGGGSDRYHSARVVWGLSLAKSAGYRVGDDGFEKALGYLRTQLSESGVADYETKSILSHALAAAGHGDFTLANQLYRNRASLSPSGLAHLSLAFAAMDRKQTASELVLSLTDRIAADAAKTTKTRGLSWNQSDTEFQALHALALENSGAGNGQLQKQIDVLMSKRTGHRWSPDKATGPAMLAACGWFARTKFEREHYKLTIVVNDLVAKELEIDADSRTQTIDIPHEFLDPKKSEQRVRFEITGRGRFSYQCVLGGFVPAEQLKSTTQDWRVVRHYEPASREMDGESIPRGFDVLRGNYATFRNDLKQLPVARRGQVELQTTRYNLPGDAPNEQLDYLVITEPLPAGVTVIESSITGGFERFEIMPGAITFYVGSRRHVEPIRYDVHGYLPGQFRTTGTLVRNAYRPDQMAVATNKPLAVLSLGSESADEYRLTPRELYELGRRQFDKGDFKLAGDYLTDLMKTWSANLDNEFYKNSSRMLLDIHLKNGPPPEVVRYFEIIIEKYPDLEIPFDKLLLVGDAYHEIGEYERGYLVFRASIEASFMRESRVAGFLQAQGELPRSVDVMTKLLREYPPESYAATAHYALAQDVYANAATAASNAKLREKKITRVDLIRQALGMLSEFLTANPEDPAADEASFSLANALIELEAYQETIDACQRFAKRYPESDYLDSFWYIIGYCHFARGEHVDALSMCDQVAKAKRIDPQSNREVDSPNKWQAIYILGQIQHSLGKAEQAIAEYKRVEEHFPDARQAIDYFTRKHIGLPEVTTIKPGDDAGVELKFRNIAACDTTVYKIDLMKFSLLKRNLGEITSINLAGIRPYYEANVKLGDGKDYRDRTKSLTLPIKEEGAYLVVCRGEELHASGLVLVSPLVVEVQENAGAGSVRATVRDVVKDRFLTDVHVKVIGSMNADFMSGDTDLRGVFVAENVTGQSTVIAQADGGRYAFFRGSTHLGPQPVSNQEPAAPQSDVTKPAEMNSGKEALLKNIQDGNSMIQQEQQKQLQNLFDNGVKSGIGGGFGGGLFQK